MAHPAQQEFLRSCFVRFGALIANAENVLEVGSQDLNGSIRDFFPDSSSKNWLGIDIGPGKGVDLVVPGELLQLPSAWADASLSSECFEHAKNWSEIFLNMIRSTRSGGLVILTFAGPGRPAHGTLDSDPYSSPFTSEYYKNISPSELLDSVKVEQYFTRFSFEVNQETCDTFFWGMRSSSIDGLEWLTPEENLARARGQLGKLVVLNRRLARDLERYELLSRSPLVGIYRIFRHFLVSGRK